MPLKIPHVGILRGAQARSLDVKFGGAELFLEGQLSTQTENVNINTKKLGITLYKKYVGMVRENNIFQNNTESFCLTGDMGIFA